jgi:hypothetical protein
MHGKELVQAEFDKQGIQCHAIESFKGNKPTNTILV